MTTDNWKSLLKRRKLFNRFDRWIARIVSIISCDSHIRLIFDPHFACDRRSENALEVASCAQFLATRLQIMTKWLSEAMTRTPSAPHSTWQHRTAQANRIGDNGFSHLANKALRKGETRKRWMSLEKVLCKKLLPKPEMNKWISDAMVVPSNKWLIFLRSDSLYQY